jgi:hypothetical protein
MARGNYEGLAKAAAIFAVTFGISVGLCGATALLSSVLRGSDKVLVPLGILETPRHGRRRGWACRRRDFRFDCVGARSVLEGRGLGMTDRQEKKGSFFTLPRVFALAVALLLVSAGLCGIQFTLQPDEYVTIEGVIGAVGLLAGCGLLLGATIGLLLKLAGKLLESRKKDL